MSSTSSTVASALPLPANGVLRGTTHFLPLRVYYEDTDAGGIVYHANYLRFAERGRTEMLRAIGIDLIELQDTHGLVFVVHRGEVDYQQPARFNDVVMVQSDLIELGGATATVAQVLHRVTPSNDLGETLVKYKAYVACMRTSGGAGRLPKDVRARMENLMSSSSAATRDRE